jgi:hypothetical protein
VSQQAAPLTPAQVRAKVDARIAQVMPTIQAKADSFLATHPGYWQAFRTHSVPPLDGADAAPTWSLKAPSDQGDPRRLRSAPRGADGDHD